MSEDEKNHLDFLNTFVDGASDCDPQTSVCASAVQPGPQVGSGSEATGSDAYPGIDFAGVVWRKKSLAGKEHIPAGYTYFGQLIGHDLGNSILLAQVPYTNKGVQPTAQSNAPLVRYNLIENPLTLETLYGTGPFMLPHLYDPKSYLFRVKPGLVYSVAHAHKDYSIRALYDSRNRDTIILHRLAVIWMKFHNKIALEINPNVEADSIDDPEIKRRVYAAARSHVLTIWHRLIRTEFLPRFVDPEVMAMSHEKLAAFKPLDETSLLHGLFRAFHSLPRRKYKFPEPRKLVDFLLPSLDDSEKAVSSWRLEWDLFFTDNPMGTKTGICASFSPALSSKDGVKISKLDLHTAQETKPLRLGDDKIECVLNNMPSVWRDQLKPEALAQKFTEEYGDVIGLRLTVDDITRSPLFLILMIEAQLYGDNGRFGPLGSLLLRRSIEDAMSKTQYVQTDTTAFTYSNPNSMHELISIAQS